jgi:sporulation protein YlmC with PRC-barrel domain
LAASAAAPKIEFPFERFTSNNHSRRLAGPTNQCLIPYKITRGPKSRAASAELRRGRHVSVQDEFSSITRGNVPMARLAYTSILVALVATCATAQAQQQGGGSAAQIMSSIPANSVTITHWYKQSVYDPNDSKIGEIMDVLVDREGKATALIVGVGGFLGMGEKDVAVPFNAVQVTNKNNNKWYLVMNSTKDALKSAKGFKYDRNAMTWVPEETPATTGTPTAPSQRPGNK